MTDHRGHIAAVPDPHDDEREPPHNLPAERATLGACLTNPDTVDTVRATLTDDDWYDTRHAIIWAAITQVHDQGDPVTPITVADAIRDPVWRRRKLDLYVIQLYSDAPLTAGTAGHHAGIIRDAAILRHIEATGVRLRQAAAHGDITRATETLDRARSDLDLAATVAANATTRTRSRDVDTFLADGTDDDTHDWIIPGLLERTDRVILTGPEGGGKSTFGRQIATQAAAGIHPFAAGSYHQPIRVLLVDLENSERQLRRELRPLRIQAADNLEPDNLHIEVRLDGLDLHSAADRRWLDQLTADTKPDLIVTGPLYKMGSGDPTTEEFAKPISATLDRLRADHGVALWIEAHAPKASNGKRRPIEPYGASLWLRWPEFGVHLSKEGALEHWRGQREVRDWPILLNRGGKWPWTPAEHDLAIKWTQVKHVIEEVGKGLSQRELSKRTGIPETSLRRVLGTYAMHYQALIHRIEQDGQDD